MNYKYPEDQEITAEGLANLIAEVVECIENVETNQTAEVFYIDPGVLKVKFQNKSFSIFIQDFDNYN